MNDLNTYLVFNRNANQGHALTSGKGPYLKVDTNNFYQSDIQGATWFESNAEAQCAAQDALRVFDRHLEYSGDTACFALGVSENTRPHYEVVTLECHIKDDK